MNKAICLFLIISLPGKLFAQRNTIPNKVMLAGKSIYMQRCATCHQVNGEGAQNMIPPLIRTTYVLGSKTRLIGIVLNGLSGEMEVNGNLYGNEMPSLSDLSDTDIAAVLTFVRNSFGNKAGAVSVESVKKVRATKKLTSIQN